MTIHAIKKSAALLLTALLFALPVHSPAQTNPPAWNAAAHYAVGDQAQIGGNVYRCIKAVTNGVSPASDYTDWELSLVRANTTLMIGTGQTFPTLFAAWTYALNARVADGEYLHFYISTAQGNFSENFSTAFLLDHGSGARIALLGDVSSNITLSFPGTNGFFLDSGHSINTISGLQISDTGPTRSEAGVVVNSGASITSMTAVVVTGFPNAVVSEHNSMITLGTGCNLSSTNLAVYAHAEGEAVIGSGVVIFATGGTLLCADDQGLLVANNIVLEHGGNQGVLAERGGVVDIPGATVDGVTSFGIEATFGGVVEATNTTVNAPTGVLASNGGIIDFSDGTVNNAITGCLCVTRGYVNCTSAAILNSSNFDLVANQGGYINDTAAAITTKSEDPTSYGYIVP